MMKYSFLLLRSEHEKFLDFLSGLGVVDVTINAYNPSQVEENIISTIKDYQNLVLRLEMIEKDNKEALADMKADFVESSEVLSTYNNLILTIERQKEKINNLTEQLNLALPWGEFSQNSIDRLSGFDISLKYFITTTKDFEKIKASFAVSEINTLGKDVYFVLVERVGFEQGDISVLKSCRELSAPSRSHIEIKTELDTLVQENVSALEDLTKLALSLKTVKQSIEELKSELHYNQIKESNQKIAEDSLVVIEGYVPEEKATEMDKAFESLTTTLVFKDKPTIDDNPPVLLKNSKFARSAEFITKLYSLPKYDEVDMTAFYAPFFMLFVGMCIGDAGYGLLIMAGAIAAKFKIKEENMSNILNLVIYCSIATVFMGTITGVFFGEEMATWEVFSPISHLFIPSNDMFGIAMAVGVVQILYAIVLRSIIKMRRYGFLYGLSGLGWVVIVISTLAAIALPKAGIEGYDTSSLAYTISAGVGFAMMFFFQDPRKNIFINIGMGLWDLYNNVTGMLGDVLSYVRLFALGLCGGVIAGIFNKLAIGMSGDIPVVKYLIMILILLIGHGINIFMSCIGSFVHPLRLTFVEFYKNVGFEGGGRGYNPFKKNKNK